MSKAKACSIFSNYNIGAGLREEAINVSKGFQKPPGRGEKRKLFAYYCLATAMKKLGIHYDDEMISTVVGLSQSKENIAKSMSILRECMPIAQYETLVYEIPDLVSMFYEKLCSQPASLDCRRSTKEILDKMPCLRNKKAEPLAIALLLYHLQTIGIDYEVKTLSKISDESPDTIRSIYNEIVKIAAD
jgi:hypothetical protein